MGLTEDSSQTPAGVVELQEADIRHRIMLVKINRLYQEGMAEDVLYNSVRGIWRASLNRVKTVDYVFGVYKSQIVAVYKPTEWFVCKDAKDKLPRQDIVLTPENENRVFFIDKGFENHEPMDEAEKFYLNKSVAKLNYNEKSQNPIKYLNPSK